MKALTSHFATLALAVTSALAGAGSTLAQSAPAEQKPNAADQCEKIESAESRKYCLDLGRVTNALKAGDFKEASRLQTVINDEMQARKTAEQPQSVQTLPSPSLPPSP